MKRRRGKAMADAPKSPLLPALPVASHPSAQAQATQPAGWTYWEKFPGVTPLGLVNKTPAGGQWYVDINDAQVFAGPSSFTIGPDPTAPKVLSAFIGLYHL